MRPLVSVIIPMFNEEENAAETLSALATELEAQCWSFELIPVNDGSADRTASILSQVAEADTRIRPVVYQHNRGEGYAQRRGFAQATGHYIAVIDADLSYEPFTVVRMVRALLDDPEADLALASPYMPGGSVDGVPPVRLALSKGGNWILRRALPKPIWTSTGIVRAFRSESLHSLNLESDGKELNLEVLSNAISLGMRIVEIPATLKSRAKGTSKFRPRSTIESHLAFTIFEKSAAVFAAIGALLIVIAVLIALYLLGDYFQGRLDPERPLMTVMVILFLGGSSALGFSLMAMQMLTLRRMIVRLQSDVRTSASRDVEDRIGPDEPLRGCVAVEKSA